MDGKFRLRAKGMEIEWEGNVEFLRDELPSIVEAFVASLGAFSDDDLDEPAGEELNPNGSGDRIQITTAALAGKMHLKTGGELLKAALARLHLVNGHQTANRKEILREMQTAKSLYRPSMSANLSATIANLIKVREVNEPLHRHYALMPSELERFRRELV